MLSEWFAPLDVRAFRRLHLHRQPFALPGAARGAVPLLDWEIFGRVLGAEPQPDALVARDGRLAGARAPRDLRAARALMQTGAGIVVRQAERHDAALAALARRFERDLPGEAHVQLYCTPAETQTFGWHFDFEDVFIVQTAGSKDYYLRENTVARGGDPRQLRDFSAIRDERSPLMVARLLPGDWLYVPSGWWHLVRSLEDSLSISTGIVLAQCSVDPPGARAPERLFAKGLGTKM